VSALRQLGLVVHPTRRIDSVLRAISAWAAPHGVAVGQVPVAGQARKVAEPVEAGDCDLLLAIGGDGTALHALRAGAAASRPVLAVACGSIGVLTAVGAEGVVVALDQVAADRFTAEPVPGLEVSCPDLHVGVAVNDVAVVRAGPGQIMVSIRVDEVLYARVIGDGVVVASALGSSAYSMAAGGPILAAGVEGMVVTPLESHGGCTPPLVVAEASVIALEVGLSFGGTRCELDGRPADLAGHHLTIRHRREYGKLVALADQEPRLAGLRRRGLVLDAPRALIHDQED
jgi:NAD+ kinase